MAALGGYRRPVLKFFSAKEVRGSMRSRVSISGNNVAAWRLKGHLPGGRYALVTDTVPPSLSALGICLEEYEYPYPVQFLPLSSDLQPVSIGYGDIPPDTKPNGKTVVMFHGKAFGGYYFRNVIEALTGAGYPTWSSPASSSLSSCRSWPAEAGRLMSC
jgi:hypothetical protein